MERKELIERIVDELGEKAIPRLIELLKKEEDPETWELIADALIAIGQKGQDALYEEFVASITPTPVKNDPYPLTLASALAEVRDERLKRHLPELMEYYDELGQMFIYDIMVELGVYDDSLVDVVGYHLLDPSSQSENVELAVVVLAKMASEKSLDYLIRAYSEFSSRENPSMIALILEGIYQAVVKNPHLEEKLRTYENAEEILERLRALLGERE
ncbi:MAG: hypothetical protein PWP37_151 [Thermotogota bacterium]|nr:hypothetical protein [Thermotogota bacterium]MDK2863959.1 hypothetical protein [Thermotogota bacterium]HCZ05771.1 hypothetical protein [Thermotogota bacterium]